jgi:predicted NACHT family NTPase
MNLAYKMQEKGLKSADRIFIVETLKPLLKIKKNETEEEHRERIEKWFDDAEPKCGLLKKEKGGYEFWHLTFQEFLTAVYMVKKFQDYNQAIEPYWENKNYKEVIEMFISYLSFENDEWANSIVLNAINDNREGEAAHKKWILASKGFFGYPKRQASR